MQEQYIAPELKLVGNATQVVLGFFGSGGDADGCEQTPDMEFETD